VPVLAACWVLYSIAGIVVAARLYSQARIRYQFGWGDAIISLAMVCGLIRPDHFPILTSKVVLLSPYRPQSGGS
jgi:hypothetical protein